MLGLIDFLKATGFEISTESLKIHLACWNGREHPIDVYYAGDFDSWQSHQSKRNFGYNQVVALIDFGIPYCIACSSGQNRRAMRNIFDQYDQPENKLTHALCCTLANDHHLICPFLTWLGIHSVPHQRDLKIVQQKIPGVVTSADDENPKGLPDLCVYTDDDWIVLFEMKVQSKLSSGQLRRHIDTAKRYGFENPYLVTVTVDPPEILSGFNHCSIQWRELYGWFDQKSDKSFWAREFVDYMQVFESKMIGFEYDIRGTITMFNGLRFDEEHPYTYREGKRLLRLLGDELQARPDLRDQLGIDPQGERRPAITGSAGSASAVWDFIPLSIARGADFTKFPHLSFLIGPTKLVAGVTVPNGICGGFKSKLKSAGQEGFFKLIRTVESNLRTVVKKSIGAKSVMSASQRHFPSRSSKAVQDGTIEADLRTCVESSKTGVKYQPQWSEAIYHLLIKKRSNIQFGIAMNFSYDCPRIQSAEAVDLFAKSWIGMKPLLDFALSD
jgi:hypothetical protein